MGKSGNPALQEKLNGAISVWSNSYGIPTGYGQQVTLLIDRFKRQGLDVANISNFGLEGMVSTITTPYGDVPHYPRSFHPYGQDAAPLDHMTFVNSVADRPGFPNVFFTLYDVWVLESPHYQAMTDIWSWVPIDHVTLPPGVKKWLEKPNVLPIAMAPWGKETFDKEGIESIYIPHAIDTKVTKETYELSNGQNVLDYFKANERFVVGMVAANKATGPIHRKAYNENLLAYSIFASRHKDVVLYLHTDVMGSGIGWNLMELMAGLGIPKEQVMVVNPLEYRYGSKVQDMAAYYTGMDVLLATSMGEGFGVPTIEAQATGTRVIGSNWAATKDLVSEDCWLVDGTPMWDAGQLAWWQIPRVPEIVGALEEAYKQGKMRSQASVKFASQFDIETVWKKSWMPLLRTKF